MTDFRRPKTSGSGAGHAVPACLALVLLLSACGETNGGGEGSPRDAATGGAGGSAALPDGSAALPDGGATERGSLVVGPAWVSSHLDDPAVQVVDARTAYPGGHIPGALAIPSESLVDTGSPIAGIIAPAADAATTLSLAGLKNGTTVVVYGDSPEYEPARVVWALRYYRHGDVRYLDGGFTGWIDTGGPVDPGPAGSPAPTRTAYEVPSVDDALVVTGSWLRDQLGEPPHANVGIQIVDARSPGEYSAGHVPTALHVAWERNLPGGRLISGTTDLGSTPYAALDRSVTTVAYCLVGWRASVAWLTLTELGFTDVRVYDGSWAEWGQGGFPVE